MWFHSHSTCPLCRSLVEAASPTKPRLSVVVVNDISSQGLFLFPCLESNPW
ncbi:hypothetical protein LINPERPRIM_LOCUS2560 [Linum perenne]